MFNVLCMISKFRAKDKSKIFSKEILKHKKEKCEEFKILCWNNQTMLKNEEEKTMQNGDCKHSGCANAFNNSNVQEKEEQKNRQT